MEVNVITGGGSGIGYATAQFLPKDQLVLITGRSEKRLTEAALRLQNEGHLVETATCDVSEQESVYKLIQKASGLGIVRSVIHAAGVSASQATLTEIIRINALGVVHIVRGFSPIMKPDGCIAVIGSCSSAALPGILLPRRSYPLALTNESAFIRRGTARAKLMPNDFLQKSFAYCMTKNFVRWYLLGCAFHYAQENVRIVCISPGVVDTDLGQAELKNPETQAILRYTGLNRPAKPEEIGFLTSTVVDERNGYLLGTDIFCDGGCTAAGFGMMAAIREKVDPPISFRACFKL